MGVEPHDVTQHPQEARVGDIPALGKDRVIAGQRVFKPPTFDRHAKAHIAVHGWHVELVEEPHEVWVIDVVIDNKASIHRLLPVAARQNGARVTSETLLGFKQGDVVVARQRMRRTHSGDAPTDHFVSAPRASLQRAFRSPVGFW